MYVHESVWTHCLWVHEQNQSRQEWGRSRNGWNSSIYAQRMLVQAGRDSHTHTHTHTLTSPQTGCFHLKHICAKADAATSAKMWCTYKGITPLRTHQQTHTYSENLKCFGGGPHFSAHFAYDLCSVILMGFIFAVRATLYSYVLYLLEPLNASVDTFWVLIEFRKQNTPGCGSPINNLFSIIKKSKYDNGLFCQTVNNAVCTKKPLWHFFIPTLWKETRLYKS